ncbi:sigma factor-like helix-turn-helix DNA-binding protein [Streptomyces smyrnaeus]|uniref:RNA polymerase sigma factor n=1 Tax=Streptomyces smyrnaeus TaxID=1387713 RepID=UPI00378D411B
MGRTDQTEQAEQFVVEASGAQETTPQAAQEAPQEPEGQESAEPSQPPQTTDVTTDVVETPGSAEPTDAAVAEDAQDTQEPAEKVQAAEAPAAEAESAEAEAKAPLAPDGAESSAASEEPPAPVADGDQDANSQDANSQATLPPTPRSESQPGAVGPPRVSAPAPRSEPEPRVEVVASVPGPVAEFLRSARQSTALPDDPVAAFDELYRRQARALTRQALLLSGHRQVAERAVRWAFHQAWQHWPKVLAATDPTRMVRATVYEYALSPWHQFHPGRRRPQPYPMAPADRAVLEAFLGLPRSYRAALLLHYGLGLTLPETATEVECSTQAAAGRVTHGRAAMEEDWPLLARTPRRQRGAVLARTLRELAAAQPVRPLPPRLVRRESLRTTRMWTRASIGLTAAVTAATVFTLLTTETGGTPSDKPVRTPPRTFAPVSLPGGPSTGVGTDTGTGTGTGAGTSMRTGVDAAAGTTTVERGPGRGPDLGQGGGVGSDTTRTSDADKAGRAHRKPAGGAGHAYLPQLRSTNERVHLRDFQQPQKWERNS